jgi:N-acetylmuramoyl-L-alanine amidase
MLRRSAYSPGTSGLCDRFPMMLVDLADAVRASGLPVAEVPGWRTRGHGPMKAVRSIICHHTAGPAAGDAPSLGVVRDGRPDLPGPLGHLVLARSGRVHVVAAGLCYHAGRTFETWQANANAIGIEAEATGRDEWPAGQYAAYVRLCRALADHYQVPVARVLGHREVAKPAGRKIDPNFDMAAFRAAVRVAHLVDERV